MNGVKDEAAELVRPLPNQALVADARNSFLRAWGALEGPAGERCDHGLQGEAGTDRIKRSQGPCF